VIKVSQAVSGEIVSEKLIDTLMRTAIEYAGAERGVLLSLRAAEWRIEAEATTRSDTVIVHLQDRAVAPTALPQSVLHYVERTHDSVILRDASAEDPFSADPYVAQRRARSVLCLPLINQAKLVGVLYLENNLAAGVFAPTRLPVLKLLTSQSATSLENARLYGDLADREARIRRLVDANIVGIFMWDLDGPIRDANDAFLRIVGYDRADLAAGIRWTDLTPPEWLDRDQHHWTPQLKVTGSLQPFEKEYFRKDGSRVPVLIGLASFDDTGSQGVAFVLDLTDRKRADEEREKMHQLQADLAYLSRVTTMGELAASLSHEIKQPIAAAVTNANVCMRWLRRETPDIPEARDAAARVVADARRAAEIVDRVRSLYRRESPERTRVDLNALIREMAALLRDRAHQQSIAIRTELDPALPTTTADRVQLQQVLMNLMLNGIEAMKDAPGELVIASQQIGDGESLVSVSDAGIGLPAGPADRIFDAFFTTKPHGTGMGLSVSRRIIESHGGRLWAFANPGRPGSTFQFTLPTA